MIKSMKALTVLYFAIWFIPLLLCLLYYLGIFGIRHILYDEVTTYIIQVVTCVLTLGSIYVCLKLFKYGQVVNSIKKEPAKSLRKYINWNTLRYIWLILMLLANMFTYYITDTGEVYIALGAALLLSTCFCFPSAQECEYIVNSEENK
jgi:hypothetical protein